MSIPNAIKYLLVAKDELPPEDYEEINKIYDVLCTLHAKYKKELSN